MNKYWRVLIAVLVVIGVGAIIIAMKAAPPKGDDNTDGTLNSPTQWTGYIETFDSYKYKGVTEATNKDQHFLL